MRNEHAVKGFVTGSMSALMRCGFAAQPEKL